MIEADVIHVRSFIFDGVIYFPAPPCEINRPNLSRKIVTVILFLIPRHPQHGEGQQGEEMFG